MEQVPFLKIKQVLDLLGLIAMVKNTVKVFIFLRMALNMKVEKPNQL